MLFRIFKLEPGFPPWKSHTRDGFYSQGVIFVGSPGHSYSVIIGTRDRNPPIRTRERIKRSVIAAWESLFDPAFLQENEPGVIPPPYAISVIPDSASPAGETEFPPIGNSGFYLVFALLESETAVSESDEQSTHEELLQMFTAQYAGVNSKPRIALVTLYNCSVQVIPGPGPELGELEVRRGKHRR